MASTKKISKHLVTGIVLIVVLFIATLMLYKVDVTEDRKSVV